MKEKETVFDVFSRHSFFVVTPFPASSCSLLASTSAAQRERKTQNQHNRRLRSDRSIRTRSPSRSSSKKKTATKHIRCRPVLPALPLHKDRLLESVMGYFSARIEFQAHDVVSRPLRRRAIVHVCASLTHYIVLEFSREIKREKYPTILNAPN